MALLMYWTSLTQRYLNNKIGNQTICTGREESRGTLAHTRTRFILTDTPHCTLSCRNSLHACRQKFFYKFRDFRAVAKMGPIFCISKTVEVKVSQDYRACWQGAWGSHSQDTQFSSLEFSRINSPHNHTSSVKEKIHNFLSLLLKIQR